MSDDRIKNIDRSVIDSMSIATLQGLIKDDFENPNGILDEETRLYVMQVLALREKEQGTEIPDAEAALEEFKREYLPMADEVSSIYDEDDESKDNVIELKQKKKLRRPAIRILAAVIAVVLLGTVTASATNFDLWSRFVNWTKQAFGFSEQVQFDEEAKFPGQLSKMIDDMKSRGISPEGIMPAYLPEGFIAEEGQTQCIELENTVLFVCLLTKEDSNIMVQYTFYTDGNIEDGTTVYSKDDGEPEEYKIGGITHYIMTNAGEYLTVWRNGAMECSISGVDSRDELIKIIDSIYIDSAYKG